jgi:hypothetical protein
MRHPPAQWVELRPAAEWFATFQEAGVDLVAYDGALCSEAAAPLTQAVRRIEASPGDYRLPGRPGRETSVLDVLRWAAEHCARSPKAIMKVRVRNA